ncbi:MAG TPA: chemotaxis protein CheW [Nitrospiraceae bacterium]|nr:chemotaxis protein CheW [Nitrospiraceae bacterium]HBI24471.1 chemotaxis protein CheW [Nitrospiraceae bacterium]
MDWEEIYRRIENVRLAIEQGFQPTGEVLQRILGERAKILAGGAEDKSERGEYLEVAEFLLAHERYAIETRHIREVYSVTDLTPIPCTPPFVFGIINVRGEIVSVIDIKKFFDLPEKGITDLNKAIILQSKDIEIGILVDAVLGVRNIFITELEGGLPTLTGIREEYLKGITKERQVILDAEKLLSDRRIIVDEKVQL